MNYRIVIVLALLVTGCSLSPVYEIAEGEDSAEMSVLALNDSVGTTVKRVDVRIYRDDKCNAFESGTLLDYAVGNDPNHAVDNAKIPAGKKVYLEFVYGDATWALSERICVALVGFTPESGASYKAAFLVTGNVSGCAVSIMDEAMGDQVDLERPESICYKPFNLDLKNGQPVHTRKEYVMTSTQAR